MGATALFGWAEVTTAQPTHTGPPEREVRDGGLVIPRSADPSAAADALREMRVTGANFHETPFRHREQADLIVTGPLLMQQALDHAEGGPLPVYPGP